MSHAAPFSYFRKNYGVLPKTPVQDPGRALQEHRARVRKQMASKCIFVFSRKLRCHGPRPPSRTPAGPSRSTEPGYESRWQTNAFSYFHENYVVKPKTPVQDPGRALQEHRARVRKQMNFLSFAKTTLSRPKTPVQDPGRALQEHRARVRKQIGRQMLFRIFAKTTVSRPKTPVQHPGRALQEHRARVRNQMASKCVLIFLRKLQCHGPRPPSRTQAGPSRSTGPE
jgi:hypothetical protein